MGDAAEWNGDWAWSLPLIAVTVMFHVIGIGMINMRVIQITNIMKGHRHFVYGFALAMGVTTILTTLLHAAEAGMWAVAYRALGAMADNSSALLYSLSAITTYGHADIHLAAHWQLMGALEALNGLILFGLTTAFMYGMIQRVWADRGAGMACLPAVLVAASEHAEIETARNLPASRNMPSQRVLSQRYIIITQRVPNEENSRSDSARSGSGVRRSDGLFCPSHRRRGRCRRAGQWRHRR